MIILYILQPVVALFDNVLFYHIHVLHTAILKLFLQLLYLTTEIKLKYP